MQQQHCAAALDLALPLTDALMLFNKPAAELRSKLQPLRIAFRQALQGALLVLGGGGWDDASPPGSFDRPSTLLSL